jgi:hypothetical protein
MLLLSHQGDASGTYSSATSISGLWKMTAEFRWLLQKGGQQRQTWSTLYTIDTLTHAEIVLGNTNFGTTPGAWTTMVHISSWNLFPQGLFVQWNHANIGANFTGI